MITRDEVLTVIRSITSIPDDDPAYNIELSLNEWVTVCQAIYEKGRSDSFKQIMEGMKE